MKKYKNLLFIIASLCVIYYLFFEYRNPQNNAENKLRLKGKLMDALYVNREGNEIVWFLTNGTSTYIKETNSGGSYTSEQKALTKKIWLYKYSMNNKKIISRKKLKIDFIPYKMRLIQKDNKILLVNNSYNDMYYLAFDNLTGDSVETLSQFRRRFPIVSAGIATLYYQDNCNNYSSYLDIKTRDGYSLIYSILFDTIFKQTKDLSESVYNYFKGKQIGFELIYEPNSGSSERKILCKKEWEEATYDYNTYQDGKMVKIVKKTGFMNEIKTILDSNKVFLNGELMYQDQKCAIVLHDAGIGDAEEDRQRYFTCCSRDGNILWEINAVKRMSDKIKRTENSFTNLFFLRSNFQINRVNGLFTICFTGEDEVFYVVNASEGKEKIKLKL